ncbi:hypothetical protein Ancab_012200 [Ancistrocladus abbreviatus]
MRRGRGEMPSFHNTNRDSDASFCSGRPSTSSIGTAGYGGRAAAASEPVNKQVAIRNINTYLSSHNFPFSLSLKPLPSTKDITATLRFVVSRIGFTVSKVEDDLPLLLKFLNCPLKLQKSVLRAAPPPHSFPALLAVIYWLVQIADYSDHLSSIDGTGLYTLLQMEAQLNFIKNETQDYFSRCATEAKQMIVDVDIEYRDLERMEKEATDTLKAAELKSRETMKQSEEEIQMCAYELFVLIDSVSKYKENMESKISEAKKDLIDIVKFISDAYKSTL